MPVYTYRCEECGVVFDVHLGYNDPQPEVCPECGAHALRRVYKPVGIIFKGSGFYATDHRSSSGNGSGKSNKKSSSESAASTSAKEESKTKSESKAVASEPTAQA